MNPGNNGKDINTWQLIDKDLQGKIKLSDEEIIELAKIGKQIEDHYQFPKISNGRKRTVNILSYRHVRLPQSKKRLKKNRKLMLRYC